MELLSTYLESQAFKDAMEKGIAEHVSSLRLKGPVPYLETAFVAEATAAKAVIDAWLHDQFAELNKRRVDAGKEQLAQLQLDENDDDDDDDCDEETCAHEIWEEWSEGGAIIPKNHPLSSEPFHSIHTLLHVLWDFHTKYNAENVLLDWIHENGWAKEVRDFLAKNYHHP